MKKENKKELQILLDKLNKSTEQILTKSSYTSDVAKIKILEELIREQLNNENTHSTAC